MLELKYHISTARNTGHLKYPAAVNQSGEQLRTESMERRKELAEMKEQIQPVDAFLLIPSLWVAEGTYKLMYRWNVACKSTLLLLLEAHPTTHWRGKSD